MSNILIAGNPDYGLAQALNEQWKESHVRDMAFKSRSFSNTDLTNVHEQKEFARLSLEHEVTILISCMWGYEQVKLAERVAKQWIEHKHDGYLIVLGSSADTPVKGSAWSYPVEKKALRAYCRQLSQISAGDNEYTFKVTYLSPGNMHTPKQDEKLPNSPKLNTEYVANIIDLLVHQPDNVNISELTLDIIPNE
jgi:hypothetical protein